MDLRDQNQMHKDHISWSSEIAVWERDSRMWHQELQSLRKALRSIMIACQEHEKGLDVHLNTIKKHRLSFQISQA